MSLTAKLRDQRFDYIRFTLDMDVNELVEFVGSCATVCLDPDGVTLAFDGPFNSDEAFVLDEDDILVRIFDDIEVFTAEQFAGYFV
jgi:hypothetical protein